MKDFLRLSGKVVIVLFCLWHMGAVALYAAPGGSTNGIIMGLRERFSSSVTPYMLWTSQWQQWNLFSPDPLRRVTTYIIERTNEDGQWEVIENLYPGALPWWRHAAQFKMLGSLLDGSDSETQKRLAERYLQVKCRDHGLTDGTPVRLSYSYWVIPYTEESMPVDWWWNYVPEESMYVGHETACDGASLIPPPA